MGVFVIAEAGVNHNGDLALALDLVEAAAQAGADAVKFQIFKAAALATAAAPKAGYQRRTTAGAESQVEMLRGLELGEDDFRVLAERCSERGIRFLASPFDEASLDFLVQELDVPVLKLPSGEITNGPFLVRAAQSGRPIILSTGMSTLDEVRDALGLLAWGYGGKKGPVPEDLAILRDRITLLHCTSEYPAPFQDVNLRAMDTMRAAFGLPVGFSDHTPGIAAALAATALGATVVEKHFTLDRGLPGPDHRASLEPGELAAMVEGIRQVEAALGDGVKTPRSSELETRAVARRSLVAIRPIRKGEALTADNLGAKRPGGGLSPMRFWDLEGRPASRDYGLDEPIAED
ncbi:MAG: N-acetylneuraminate synthase [Magnetospirillum sp. WYHS-4]